MHGEHRCRASRREYHPGAHASHVVLRASGAAPAGHGWHAVASGVSENHPSAHATQTEEEPESSSEDGAEEEEAASEADSGARADASVPSASVPSRASSTNPSASSKETSYVSVTFSPLAASTARTITSALVVGASGRAGRDTANDWNDRSGVSSARRTLDAASGYPSTRTSTAARASKGATENATPSTAAPSDETDGTATR